MSSAELLTDSADAAPREPRQKPGRSKQDYATPADFIEAVVGRFGPIAFDLSAHAENTKAEAYYGPGSLLAEDSLTQDWTLLEGNLWLNPEFGDIAPWAAKCAASWAAVEAFAGRRNRHNFRILLLTPASVGSNWFADHVHRKAHIIGLSPRMSFDGVAPYPKDLMLSCYGEPPGFDTWRWKP